MTRHRRSVQRTGASRGSSADAEECGVGARDRLVRSRAIRVNLAIVFAVAVAIRLLHIWQLRESPFFTVLVGDSRGYDEWARRLAAGDWIGGDVFYQAPLYPYFLGVIYALLGHDLLIVRLVQAVLGSFSCVLLSLAATRLFSPRAGFIAGLMLALYAPMVFVDAVIQKSVLDLFLICLALWLVSILLDRPDARGVWLGLGATLGALGLNRENALVLAAVAVAWAAYAWRRPPSAAIRFGGLVALTAGLVFVVAPVAARNRLVGGGLYLTTSQFGSNFYIGNNPRADGTYMALREGRGDPAFERQDATELAERTLGRHLSPGEVSQFWRDQALQFMASDPTAWARLLARKVQLLLSDTEMIDTEAQESHAEWSLPLRIGGVFGRFGILLPLAVLGVVATWSDRRRLGIIYALTLAYAASVLMFFVVARYRYPLVPFLVLFAAAGLANLRIFLKADRRRQLAAAAAMAAVAVFAQWPALSAADMRAITETNLGVALQTDRRYEDAIPHYRRAIAIKPDYAPAYNNLGVALRALGQPDEAAVAYREALTRRPNFLEVHYNLATLLLEQGKSDEALAHFVEARAAMPSTGVAHHNFGVALAATGRRDEAIAEFQAALQLSPESTTVLRSLADALARERRYADAAVHLRQVTRLEPANADAHHALGSVSMAAGALPEATAAFRAAVSLAPDHAQAHSDLGVALAAQGKMEEAIAEFERAVSLKPDYAEAARYLAKAREQVRRVR